MKNKKWGRRGRMRLTWRRMIKGTGRVQLHASSSPHSFNFADAFYSNLIKQCNCHFSPLV